MTSLAFTRSGSGAPLVLLPGLGCSRRSWDPLVPALAERFEVIAVDLPGFGASEALPAEVEPLPAVLAAAVATTLDDLGVAIPHLVGNSLGGWIALEFAQIRTAASVTLLSPAGLWRGRAPLYCRASLRASRWFTRHTAGVLSRVVRYRLGRALILGQTHGRPTRMSAETARAVIRDMGTCPGFDATLAATATRRYRSGAPIDAPVTVAFGSRDLLLLRHQSRHLDELPPTTNQGTLPGCGHVPMQDNPLAVTALITASAGRAAHPRPEATAAGRRSLPGPS